MIAVNVIYQAEQRCNIRKILCKTSISPPCQTDKVLKIKCSYKYENYNFSSKFIEFIILSSQINDKKKQGTQTMKREV